MTISPQAALLRGFAIDFLTSHDVRAVEGIMTPDYSLSIGGHVFSGRDASYLPVTAAQLDQFPGLTVTVHDVVLAPEAIAMRFTEHGVSTKETVPAAWGGITLFEIRDGRIARGWAEEDYFARKRQLKSRIVDLVNPPHPAAWDQAVAARDEAVAATVTGWAETAPSLFHGIDEISSKGPFLVQLIEPQQVRISKMFTAGQRAALHAVVTGRYLGGFGPGHAAEGPVELRIAAIVDVADGEVRRVQLCGDRLGLQRALRS